MRVIRCRAEVIQVGCNSFQHADHPRPVETNKLRLDICIGPKIHDHAFATLQSLQLVKALSQHLNFPRQAGSDLGFRLRWPRSDFTREESVLSTKLNTLALFLVPLLPEARIAAYPLTVHSRHFDPEICNMRNPCLQAFAASVKSYPLRPVTGLHVKDVLKAGTQRAWLLHDIV
jgi:hypothetical protein